MKQRTKRILAAAAVLMLAAPASAQEAEPSETLTQIDYQAELDSINAGSTAATVLYVAGPSLFLVGAGLGLLAFSKAFGCEFTACGPGEQEAAVAGMFVSFAFSFVGLVSFFVGVGLDVDSGSRRGALERRAVREGVELTSLNIAPTEGGAALQLGGRF